MGVPHGGRHSVAAEATVGCFLDMIVVRTDLTGEPSNQTRILTQP
ncbi:hypothetical protein ACWCPM_07770 [Streptomyces sp. NPDC002309]